MSEQCDRYMPTGRRCDLLQGHEGQHQKAYAGYTASWTDESAARFCGRTLLEVRLMATVGAVKAATA